MVQRILLLCTRRSWRQASGCWGRKGRELRGCLGESGWVIPGPRRGRAVASIAGSLQEPKGAQGSFRPRTENAPGFTRLGSLGPMKGLPVASVSHPNTHRRTTVSAPLPGRGCLECQQQGAQQADRGARRT